MVGNEFDIFNGTLDGSAMLFCSIHEKFNIKLRMP